MTTHMDEVLEGLRATGASVWDHRIADLLTRHATEESDVIAAYQRLAEGPVPDAVRYLIELILTDEDHHHRVLMEMARTVAWGPLGADHHTIPDLPLPRHIDDDLLSATRRFLAVERRDRRELRRLGRELKPVADTTVWSLLVELMLLDTDKHIRILEFIERAAHTS